MDNDSSPLSIDWENSNKETKNFSGVGPEVAACESGSEEESDDYRGREKETESTEAEIVADENSEEYEEERTGVKIKYNLTPADVKRYIRHTKKYEEDQKTRMKYIFVQIILFVSLTVSALGSGFVFNAYLAVVPLFWLFMMVFNWYREVKTSSEKLLKETQLTIDIFPDRLEVQSEIGNRTIDLDGSFKSDEHKDLILISKTGENGLIIPLRAIEPDLRADVQAIIAAGCSPL